jgi:hypothetical protein
MFAVQHGPYVRTVDPDTRQDYTLATAVRDAQNTEGASAVESGGDGKWHPIHDRRRPHRRNRRGRR